jgi:hypothetical protein
MGTLKRRSIWLILLTLVTTLFFWKILFTDQFSMLLEYEGTNQGYSWDHFSAASLQKGVLPLWDPYAHSGRSFVGEMQTGLFYPLKLVLYYWPLKPGQPLSERLFHIVFVLAHLLAAAFMFLLAEELGLAAFPAFVAAICFGLGGFVGKSMWPDMVDSAIWLPLIFLCLLRALRAEARPEGAAWAGLAGLALGLSVLGGRLHLPLMNGIVVVTAAAFFACAVPSPKSQVPSRESLGRGTWDSRLGTWDWRLGTWNLRLGTWGWAASVVAIIAVVGFLFGAIQLFPSLEYSKLAIRALGGELALAARQKIPYADLNDGFLPQALVSFFHVYPFDGNVGHGEVSPYFGVLPSLLALIGMWRNWKRPWVRYLAGLAVLSFFYTLGVYSLLHGLLYALVPFLWMGREAARFIYLTHFALALLAGFGAQSLLSAEAREFLPGLLRPMNWVIGGIAAGLLAQAMLAQPPPNEWSYFTLAFLAAAWGLLAWVNLGRPLHAAVPALMVLLILFDFGPTHWIIHDKNQESKQGTNHLQALLDCANVARFLKSQPGLFRVDVTDPEPVRNSEQDLAPNIGDFYDIQTTGGMSATEYADYGRFFELDRRAFDLLNVQYFVRKKPDPANPDRRLVFEDGPWKVYRSDTSYPRAWLVHQAVVEPARDKLLKQAGDKSFDPLQAALLARPLTAPPARPAAGAAESATVERYRGDRIQIRVRAAAAGLLVLSEVDYPGWRVTVNGRPGRIERVDGLLRGVVVGAGENVVVFHYAPRSVLFGGILSAASLLGILAFAFMTLRKSSVVSHQLSVGKTAGTDH